ncbi:hypothetical protein BOO25_19025 [Vibrio navarrensis]|nr:hypothetical protein [Vibrio navarrensis]
MICPFGLKSGCKPQLSQNYYNNKPKSFGVLANSMNALSGKGRISPPFVPVPLMQAPFLLVHP